MELKNNRKDDRHKFRRFFSQFFVVSVENLHLFTSGVCYALPTIVIPALTKHSNEHNKSEFLTITSVQASWMGSFMIILNLFGSLLSGFVTDPIGRKRAMILVSIPFIIGFCILYLCTSSVSAVFVGLTFLSLADGLMTTPIMSYLGEISEVSNRSLFNGYGNIVLSFGIFVAYELNTMMSWRKVCFICANLPLITAIAVFFLLPETPQFLLSKNRTAEAKVSLRRLRGWVPYEAVAQEFEDLQRQSERSKSCYTCIKQDLACTHALPTMSEKLAELKRKQTLKPLCIIITLFFLFPFTGIVAMRPYMLQIFKAYNSPIEPDQAVTIQSIFDILGTISMMLLVRFTGKRRLYLFCMSAVLVCSATITWYGFTYLPPSRYISIDQHKPFQLDNKALEYIPFICLMTWSYFTTCGLYGIPWILFSEIFPFKSRGIACGVSASTLFVFVFIGEKTYLNLEATLSLPGVSLLFTCISFFGLMVAYNILPETENRSLEDIELHFADNSKGLTDHKIAISKPQDKTQLIEGDNNNNNHL
ncbi:facilitated trehalose transporter Tret1-like [Contarinia nasturtii]|uniref:facilitated trehalose transporter Tret1-like n=1 Tax=Contarinia nasturtii TaxID=265458 RepID=UPI0012D44BAB|nr:facilitated trehalose transporter Tret1-like [Contarinia nasturtii]